MGCCVVVCCFTVLGLVVFTVRMRRIDMGSSNTFSISEFIGSFRFWREWLWHISYAVVIIRWIGIAD